MPGLAWRDTGHMAHMPGVTLVPKKSQRQHHASLTIIYRIMPVARGAGGRGSLRPFGSIPGVKITKLIIIHFKMN